jgi:hypothetical protein
MVPPVARRPSTVVPASPTPTYKGPRATTNESRNNNASALQGKRPRSGDDNKENAERPAPKRTTIQRDNEGGMQSRLSHEVTEPSALRRNILGESPAVSTGIEIKEEEHSDEGTTGHNGSRATSAFSGSRMEATSAVPEPQSTQRRLSPQMVMHCPGEKTKDNILLDLYGVMDVDSSIIYAKVRESITQPSFSY